MKKQKSKSLVLDNIMSQVDEQFVDGIGRKHYPFNKTIATILVEDELECRLQEPTPEDKNDK